MPMPLMNHPSLQPLQVLLEQAEHERDAALARQNQARQAHAAAQAQQTQLHDYRREYEHRWSAQFREGVTMTLMQCYQDFVARLHGAVDLQGEQVGRLAQVLERHRAETLAAEMRVASVRKLIERRQLALLLGDERRAQKTQDEQASRAAWQRLAQDAADQAAARAEADTLFLPD